MRPQQMERSPNDPDEVEILRLCEKIREGWTRKEHRRRLAYPVDPIEVTVAHLGDLPREIGRTV